MYLNLLAQWKQRQTADSIRFLFLGSGFFFFLVDSGFQAPNLYPTPPGKSDSKSMTD